MCVWRIDEETVGPAKMRLDFRIKLFVFVSAAVQFVSVHVSRRDEQQKPQILVRDHKHNTPVTTDTYTPTTTLNQ